MNCIDLSSEEVVLLKNHFQKSPIALIRSKVMAVMMRHHRMKIKDIASSIFRQERTISRWIRDFSTRRMSSLFSGLEDNENASKLTRDQKEQIKKVIGQPPDEHGLPEEFWDVSKLKNYVSANFGVVYESNQSYHYLLKFSGLSFKYPDKLSPNRNEELITQRIAKIKTEIAPLLKDPNWMVFAADEVRVQLESEIRRAWLVRGKRTIVKTQRSDEHQNYLGFLDQKSGGCQVYEIVKGKQK